MIGINAFGTRTYFLKKGRIIKVGSDTWCSRVFPDLAGKSAVRVEVVFDRSRTYIVRIIMDYIYFDEDGRINHYPQDLRLAELLERGLSESERQEKARGKVLLFRYRPKRVIMTDLQKQLLKERINRDFGEGTWESLPGQMRKGLWANNCGVV